ADADPWIAELGEDRILDLPRDLAPKVRRVAELDGALVDPEIGGSRGDPVEDDRAPAGALQLSAPVAARLRLAEAAGERRLGADAVASGAGYRRTGEHAGRNDENIVGPEGGRALGYVLQEIVRDEPAPAGIGAEEEIARLLDRGGPVGEVHVQNLVPVAVPFHQAPPVFVVVASPSAAAPPSIGLNSMTSAPSWRGASRSACSPSTAMVSSASGAIPIIASRSSPVARSDTVSVCGPSVPRGRKRRRSAKNVTMTVIVLACVLVESRGPVMTIQLEDTARAQWPPLQVREEICDGTWIRGVRRHLARSHPRVRARGRAPRL